MPLPLMVPIVFLISIPISMLSSYMIYKLVDWIRETISARKLRITCLGANETGKTTFINFLLHEEITTLYKGTMPKELKKGKKIKMADLNIRIPDFNDLYGSDLNYPNWKAEFLKSDICFYMVNICRWENDDNNYRDRVSKDISRLASWSDGDKKPFIFYLFSFCDMLPLYEPGNPKKFRDILTREFKEYHEKQLIKCRSKQEYATCSMHSEYIQTSIFNVLKIVANYIKNKDI